MTSGLFTGKGFAKALHFLLLHARLSIRDWASKKTHGPFRRHTLLVRRPQNYRLDYPASHRGGRTVFATFKCAIHADRFKLRIMRCLCTFQTKDSKNFKAEVENLGQTKVENIMTRDVVTVKPDSDIKSLIELITSKRINPVPVIDDQDGLVGIVSRADLVKILKNY